MRSEDEEAKAKANEGGRFERERDRCESMRCSWAAHRAPRVPPAIGMHRRKSQHEIGYSK